MVSKILSGNAEEVGQTSKFTGSSGQNEPLHTESQSQGVTVRPGGGHKAAVARDPLRIYICSELRSEEDSVFTSFSWGKEKHRLSVDRVWGTAASRSVERSVSPISLVDSRFSGGKWNGKREREEEMEVEAERRRRRLKGEPNKAMWKKE